MSSRKICFLLIIFLAIGPNLLLSQELNFIVDLGGKKIGEITAVKTKSENVETYEVLSEVTFHVLWKKYNRVSSNWVVYKDNSMWGFFAGSYMNNDLEDSVTMNWVEDQYNCYRHPNEQSVIRDTKVNFTSIQLYFGEPVGVQEIYSEQHLEFCRLEELEDEKHKYKLHLPNGNVNYYTYEKNELVEVLIDRTWFDLRFLRI